jgi:hypothetical protein
VRHEHQCGLSTPFPRAAATSIERGRGSSPEPDAFAARFVDRFVNSAAAFGVINLHSDLMLYADCIVNLQFDRLQSVEPDDAFASGLRGQLVKLFPGLHGDEGTKCCGESIIFPPSKFVVQTGELLFASRVGVQADNDCHCHDVVCATPEGRLGRSTRVDLPKAQHRQAA